MTSIEGENKNWKIFLGDSHGFIEELPNNSVDLILTDPPYNLGKYSTGNINPEWREEINNDIADWDTVTFDPSEWLEPFKRVLKPEGNIFAFTSYNLIGEWHKAFDDEFDVFQFMVWHKTNPTPKIHKVSFLNSCELIVCVWNKGHTWNFTRQNEMHNFIETSICMGKERLKDPKHPTQKPVEVLEKIVEIASNEEDVVFDPFMGVGSIGIAALKLKRKFLGAEIKKEYFEAAGERIKNFASQGNLFE